jgi:hypothetical protein
MIEEQKMKYLSKLISRWSFFNLFALFLVLYPLKAPASSDTHVTSEEISPSARLSPAQQYSGELLAYLLKVVLGPGRSTQIKGSLANEGF